MGLIIIKKKDVPATAMLYDVIKNAATKDRLRDFYTHAYVRFYNENPLDNDIEEGCELFFTDGSRLICVRNKIGTKYQDWEPGFYRVLSAKRTEIIFEKVADDLDYPPVDKIMTGFTADWEACKNDNFLNDHGDYAAIIRAFKENIIKPAYILPFTEQCLKWYVHKDNAPMKITIAGGHECYIMPMSSRG